jgi:hypothetical protein
MQNELRKLIDKVENKFSSQKERDYFVGYSVKKGKKTEVNIIIDDRDIQKMSKADLLGKLQEILNKMNPAQGKISVKPTLISDLNDSNIWNLLGDSAVVRNVKALTTFLNIKLPEGFQIAFEELPVKFKLDDLRRELKKITGKEYHRNTYQTWLNFLRNAEYVELKEKTYVKIPKSNRYSILKEKTIKDE